MYALRGVSFSSAQDHIRVIYSRIFLGKWYHSNPSSAFPPLPFAGLEALPLASSQTAMIHPFSFLEHDSHPESIYDLLDLKVDRALIGTRSRFQLLFRVSVR